MRILLVDDSLTIRSLVRRTLADLVPADIVEAANGVEALAHLARRRFDLVVLDVNMPVMDGVETLEAIRTTPDYAGVPVVLLTSEKNEPVVRRLVELGITDFLSKPLSQNVLAERLARILARLRESAPARTGGAPAGHRMLVVEQDPDRRHLLLDALAGHYEVLEADSAAAALQVCLGTPAPSLDFVIVGSQVGLPPVEMFVAKLRTVPHLAHTRLIACVARGEVVAEPRRHLFDGFIERTCVPAFFLADLERLVNGTQTPMTRILLVRPSLARDVVGATEQVFGLMLSCDVEASTREALGQHRCAGAGVHAAIGLVSGGVEVLTLLFRADAVSARTIAGRMIGVPPADVQEADVLASAAELSNIVLGRLRNRLVEADVQAQIGLPRTWTGETGEVVPRDDPHAIDLGFHVPELGVSFEFLLFSPTADEAAVAQG